MPTTYADIKPGDLVSTVAREGDSFYNVTREMREVVAVEVDGIYVDITCAGGLSYSGLTTSVLEVH